MQPVLPRPCSVHPYNQQLPLITLIYDSSIFERSRERRDEKHIGFIQGIATAWPLIRLSMRCMTGPIDLSHSKPKGTCRRRASLYRSPILEL